jgi:drug/metabolite transporter (DMT)-like permease
MNRRPSSTLPQNARPLTAIALIVLAALLFSLMDASVKYVGVLLSLVVVLWTRYTIQAALMALWLWRKEGRSGFRAAHPRFQALRGALLLAVSALAFYSVRLMPLAEFTAILMLWPVLATAAAGWLFRERVGRLRWLLVCGGFIGTVIVIRPGSELFGWAALVPIVTALAATAYNLLTSRLALLDHPATTQFYTGITGALLLAPIVLLELGASSVTAGSALNDAAALHWLLLLGIGVMGTLGHLMLILAFGRSGAAALMPFTYTQIGFAAAAGWLVFRQVPDALAWIGIAIIAVCGAATAWLNVRDAQRAGRLTAAEPAAE